MADIFGRREPTSLTVGAGGEMTVTRADGTTVGLGVDDPVAGPIVSYAASATDLTAVADRVRLALGIGPGEPIAYKVVCVYADRAGTHLAVDGVWVPLTAGEVADFSRVPPAVRRARRDARADFDAALAEVRAAAEAAAAEAAEAKVLAEEAKEAAGEAAEAAGEAKSDAEEAKDEATAAWQKADEVACSSAGEDAEECARQAKDAADEAMDTADEAKDTANAAQDAAQEAKDEVEAAHAAIVVVDGRVAALETALKAVTERLAALEARPFPGAPVTPAYLKSDVPAGFVSPAELDAWNYGATVPVCQGASEFEAYKATGSTGPAEVTPAGAPAGTWSGTQPAAQSADRTPTRAAVADAAEVYAQAFGRYPSVVRVGPGAARLMDRWSYSAPGRGYGSAAWGIDVWNTFGSEWVTGNGTTTPRVSIHVLNVVVDAAYAAHDRRFEPPDGR